LFIVLYEIRIIRMYEFTIYFYLFLWISVFYCSLFIVHWFFSILSIFSSQSCFLNLNLNLNLIPQPHSSTLNMSIPFPLSRNFGTKQVVCLYLVSVHNVRFLRYSRIKKQSFTTVNSWFFNTSNALNSNIMNQTLTL